MFSPGHRVSRHLPGWKVFALTMVTMVICAAPAARSSASQNRHRESGGKSNLQDRRPGSKNIAQQTTTLMGNKAPQTTVAGKTIGGIAANLRLRASAPGAFEAACFGVRQPSGALAGAERRGGNDGVSQRNAQPSHGPPKKKRQRAGALQNPSSPSAFASPCRPTRAARMLPLKSMRQLHSNLPLFQKHRGDGKTP